MTGTLVWADGDMSEKVITIPVVDRYSDQNRAFSVELSNAQGGAQLKGWHVSAVIGLGDSLEQPEGYQGRIETGSYNDHFAEGETFEIPVSGFAVAQALSRWPTKLWVVKRLSMLTIARR